MAREFAQIRLDLWADPDVRKLTERAQRLYLFLLTNSTLTYAGVADWRPAKIAGFAADSTAASIRDAGAELAAKHFVVIDEDTEEILVRSFLRHDGLLKQPRVAVSMTTAYASTASGLLRGVMIHELHRLAAEYPEWAAWGRPQVQVIMRHEAINPKAFGVGDQEALGVDLPIDLPQIEPNAKGLPTPAPTPATAPAPSSSEDKKPRPQKRGTRFPEDFQITEAMTEWAKGISPGINIQAETESFRDFHESKGSTFQSWEAAWRTWVRNSVKFSRGPVVPVKPKASLWDQPAVTPDWAAIAHRDAEERKLAESGRGGHF